MPHVVVPAAQQTSSSGTHWHDVAQTWQAIITPGAVIVGGIFTYFKFYKDRAYRPRFNATVLGGHADVGHGHFIVGRIMLENKGSAKLSIVQDLTGMLLLEGTPDDPFEVVQWGDEPVGKVSIELGPGAEALLKTLRKRIALSD